MPAFTIGGMNKPAAEDLYRREAVDALSKRPFGRPIAKLPRSWSWVTGLIVSLAITVTAFLSQAEFARKESARGWLVADGGVARISHDKGADVAAILRKPGDNVTAGDPVLMLGEDRLLDDGSSSNSIQQEKLREQIAAVNAQISALQREVAIEARSIESQLDTLRMERSLSAGQKQVQRQRIAAAEERLDRLVKAAASGAVTAWEVLQLEDELAGLRQVLTAQQQGDIVRLREQRQLEERAQRLPLETERVIAALRGQRSTVQQALIRERVEQRIVLAAPVSGQLASIEVQVGDTIAPRQLLATVVSADLTLTADVFVPSSAIGFIRAGQPVELHYDALPHEHFGAFTGQVETISDAVLLPHDLPPTFHLREAAFKVGIAVQHPTAELESLSVTLRPGMLLNAEIILETRSLVAWLLEPLNLRRRQTV